MRTMCLTATLIAASFLSRAQETLQTVTDRGNTTTNSLQIGGAYVNANTTKLFINNQSGKNFALSSGANMRTEQGFHIYNWTDFPNIPLLSLTNTGSFTVNGDISISNSQIPMGLITELPGTSTPLLNFEVNFRSINKNNSYLGGAFRIDTRGENAGAPLFQWIKRDANSTAEPIIMSLTSSGNLGIGIMGPTEKLAVNGNIRAREVKVENATWPDYVFAKSYQLPTLQETERHIKEKGHLPGIPSAAEVWANGLDLGEINAKLLQKIEELTLHLIEQNKKMDVMKKENELIKTQFMRQQKDITILKSNANRR